MAEDAHNTSDISDPADAVGAGRELEDAETSAARRELKQTSISEKMVPLTRSAAKKEPVEAADDFQEGTQEATQENTQQATQMTARAGDEDVEVADEISGGTKTPEVMPLDVPSERLQDQISSPKKKRAHDQFDESKDSAAGSGEEEASATTATAAGAVAATNGRLTVNRTDRDEPEKKRPRDQKPEETHVEARDDKAAGDSQAAQARHKDKKPTATSSAAFAKSGFAKLASSTSSPFGALGGSSQPNLFGGGSSGGPAPSLSPFGALGGGSSQSALGSRSTTTTSPPKIDSSTTTAPAAPSSGASPFASVNGPSRGFGSGGAFRSGFSSAALGGPRLMTFARPGEALKSDRPARPFGAPESEGEEEERKKEEEDDEEESEKDKGEEDEDVEGEKGATEGAGKVKTAARDKEKDKDGDATTDADKEDAKSASDDRRKPKLQRVVIDDGEAGEVTILAVRAKMYQLEDKETGWKERGAGMLKINVPASCVSFDEAGVPIPGSFDASGLEEDDDDEEAAAAATETDDTGAQGKNTVRLIMRQDHTLRVILNTAILGATDFQERAALKATTILFTAFEGGEGKPVQMKMNHANAQAFLNEVELIKRELRGS